MMHTPFARLVGKTVRRAYTLAPTATLALGGAVYAQNSTVPSKAQSKPIAIVNAIVHTATTTQPIIEHGWVLIDNGKVLSVGVTPAELPSGVDIVDAQGMHLSPGFMASATQLGLIETMQVEATDDRTEYGEFHPESVPALAINPDSDLLGVARNAGVLLALVMPLGGSVSGSASVIKLNGWNVEDITVDARVGIVVQWPLVEASKQWWTRRSPEDQKKRLTETRARIDRFFDDAKAWVAAKSADPTVAHDERFEAMRAVLEGRDNVFMTVGSASQVETAVLWAKERGLHPVLVGSNGILDEADFLRNHGVPVIVTGTHQLPASEALHPNAPYAVPAMLSKVGIQFALASGDEPAHERNLPHNAATAVAFGLDPEAALRSITIAPAQLAGIADRYGSIEPGKSATLILTRGHPLEVTSGVAQAWIDGSELNLTNRQTRMKAKYDEKPRD
ncbi:MAG: hypothetical protein EXS10_03165 [Phycisphaerales bacterium]|nr:hypothetical protein [Phycisphaerales bacterium]